MRRLMVLVIVAAFLVAGAGPAHAAGNQVYYLALGDSLAAGCASGDYQSSFDHFSGCGGRGYDDQVAESLHSSMPSLQLVNLACGGESTESFTSEPRADCYSRSAPGISQLADAVAFLEAHPGRIVFITITIGVNDAFEACFNPEAGGLDAACVADVLPGIRSNLTHILETIQAAAPGVPVVGTTYHNPLLGLWVLVENGDQLAHANADAFEVLNSGLASTYEDAGADVADVADAFDIDNFTDTVVTKEFGDIPVNVANACAWTYFCGRPPSGPFNVHPTTVGYGVIASAVEAALDL